LGQDSATPPKKVTWDDEPYYLVSFGVHKSRRYEAKMSSFYETLGNFVLGGNAILGASAFMALIGGNNTLIAQILIGLVAAGSALDTVLGFAKKAKRHDDLCRKFTELAAKIAEWDATNENYRKACAERLRIEKDEAPVARLVDLQARNEELRARGYSSDNLAPLSRAQRYLGYFATFGMARLERWKAEHQA
jgi:hypothetical protein